MKIKTSLLGVSSFFIFLWSINAQGQDLPEPQKFGIPPPPGLPIDASISYLAAAGVLLGVFYYKGKK